MGGRQGWIQYGETLFSCISQFVVYCHLYHKQFQPQQLVRGVFLYWLACTTLNSSDDGGPVQEVAAVPLWSK